MTDLNLKRETVRAVLAENEKEYLQKVIQPYKKYGTIRYIEKTPHGHFILIRVEAELDIEKYSAEIALPVIPYIESYEWLDCGRRYRPEELGL